ncbi:MAG: ferritin family protein [Deltaproteobacteria bacterium]|nr:ferritin family protein [Deltaproteobacteria bacterium]
MYTTGNADLIKLFEYALNQEETWKSFFQRSLERMGVGAAVSAFKRLIEEAEKHIEFITRILQDLKEGSEIQPSTMERVELEPVDYFDDRARSEFLHQCIEGSMVPDVTVFKTAWLIEKDLSEFYEKMAAKTEGAALNAFQMLARWEKGHERFFREYRDKLSEVYANMPWGG